MKEQKDKSEGFAPDLGDMSAEDFRRFGHEVIDRVSDYLEHVGERPVLSQVKPGELIREIPSSPPAMGEAMETILADVDRLIPPALTHWNHPSFFAYFATSSSAPGIFGELFSAAFDVKAMLWRTSPAAIELEQVALDWLRQMMGLDYGFDGIIYDTASVASMHAISAARESLNLHVREDGMSGRTDLPLLRIYVSDQAHSSIEKAAITLGLGLRSVRKVPSDAEFRMDAQALRQAIEEDKQTGALPLCVVATVGTTSTSSIDPVPQIADICAPHKIWLHVDAAYAGSAAILPEMRHILAGSERADSLVTNPHKWLFTPFDLSVLYCRHMELLRRAFSLVPPAYLETTETETVRNGSDYGIQLGRRFRALKLWMIIRYFGHLGLASRIREHCRLAQLLARLVDESPDWERLAPTPFALLCFRACPVVEGETEDARAARLNALNETLLTNVNASGKIFLSHTRLNDAFTLRFSIGNIRTTEEHIRSAWQLLNEELARLVL
ncbi:MAG: aromatic-L-amino-acid/L-tryptophan decarboxylase [Acidobacteriota bacterium]|jgi:aromatic-L-amino-acid decarboxylase|nr:aromatic-L-amino-acid/L-tryptophan decarboxylase [Acidobacteriota bacterium]